MVKQAILIFALIIGLSIAAYSEVMVSGLLDMIVKNSDDGDITNITFKDYNNFHSIRTRIFLDSRVDDHVSLFTQILVDNQSFSIYGAYVRFDNLAKNYLNINLGFIPTTVGSFAPRTYSDKNPLIGQPLMYIHHSNYVPGRPDSIRTVDQLLATRPNRSRFGMPVIYDACWNTGAEFYGSVGKFDYSLGLLSGAVGYTTMQQSKDIPQVTTHFVYYANPSLSFGGSAFIGPYLFNGAFNDALPGVDYGAGDDDSDKYDEYLNVGVAGELHWSQGYLDLYSEIIHNYWEHPYLPNLAIDAGYIEAKYKFLPAWYFAARYDIWVPNSLTDSTGQKQHWDYPVNRVEFGIGYHPYRFVTTKLVTQINRFDDADFLDSELYSLQVSIKF